MKLTKHHTNTLGGVIVGNRGQIMSAGVLIIKSSHRISKAQLKAPVFIKMNAFLTMRHLLWIINYEKNYSHIV
jgi:hypothetical protein